MNRKVIFLAASAIASFAGMQAQAKVEAPGTVHIPLVFEQGFSPMSDDYYSKTLELEGKEVEFRLQGPVVLEGRFVLGPVNYNLVPFHSPSMIPDGDYVLESEFKILTAFDKSRISKRHPNGYPCLLSTIVNVPRKQVFTLEEGEFTGSNAIRASLTCE